MTLYHWDFPAALDDRGGWLHPDSARWFADYARVAFRALGDRVTSWATLNEPWVVVDAGFLHGVHAPGVRDVHATPRVSLHLLRAHAAAVRALRAEGCRQLGIVINLEPATLMGIQSNGMTLTASQDGPFGLLAVARDVPSGAKVR